MASGRVDSDLWLSVWFVRAGISAQNMGVNICLDVKEEFPTPQSDPSRHKFCFLKSFGKFYLWFKKKENKV